MLTMSKIQQLFPTLNKRLIRCGPPLVMAMLSTR